MTVNDNILIVPVPDDSNSLEIVDNNVSGGFCIMMLRGKPDYACEYIQLPPGTWRIVGRAKELTEEQWRNVVRKVFDSPTLYADFSNSLGITYMPMFPATESGFSLLRSHGIDPESNPLILIKEK